MFSKELINLIINYYKETYRLDISEETAELHLFELGNIYASAKDMLEEYYKLIKVRTSAKIM